MPTDWGQDPLADWELVLVDAPEEPEVPAPKLRLLLAALVDLLLLMLLAAVALAVSRAVGMDVKKVAMLPALVAACMWWWAASWLVVLSSGGVWPGGLAAGLEVEVDNPSEAAFAVSAALVNALTFSLVGQLWWGKWRWWGTKV